MDLNTVYVVGDYYDSIPTVPSQVAESGTAVFPYKWVCSTGQTLVRGYEGNLDTQIIVKMAATSAGRVEQMKERGITCRDCGAEHIMREVTEYVSDKEDPDIKRLVVHFLCLPCFGKDVARERKKMMKGKRRVRAAKVIDRDKLNAKRRRQRANRRKNRR
jgi:hypothetical protein